MSETYSASGRSDMAAKRPKLKLPSLDELRAEKEREVGSKRSKKQLEGLKGSEATAFVGTTFEETY